MVTTLPVISDILEGVVARVSAITEADLTDPFQVLFEYGPLSQVAKSVNEKTDPVVWLIEKGEPRRRQDVYGSSNSDIVIGMPTDDQWTMSQRMSTNYKPRLLVVYELLIQELKAEKKLNNPYKIDHTKYNLYYWGGGNVNGTNSPNLWEKNIDAILIENASLVIKNKC